MRSVAQPVARSAPATRAASHGHEIRRNGAVIETVGGARAEWTLPEILPHAFGPADLGH